MQFSEWANDNVLFLYFVMLVIFVIGFLTGFRRGGWNQHLPYMFTLLISVQYYLISPFFFYMNDKRIIIGTDISGYYGLGAFFPLLGLTAFISGYWIKDRNAEKKKQERLTKKDDQKVKRLIIILFCTVYALVFVNMAIGGIDVKNIFLGDVSVGLGAKGETYFLQNLADSLITIIILGYVYGNNKRHLIIGIILAFFLFSLLGFRYRILLTLFGLTFAYLYHHRIRFKEFLVALSAVLVFFYFIMLVTENRFELIQRQYSMLRYDPREFNYSNYFEQTRGALADMAVYKVYDNPNKTVSHDYGASMFAYIFIRMIPRAVYPDKDEFYPPPQSKVQFQAYDAWWGKVSGEAILSAACFYIAFGWPGVIFFHFFWGILIAWIRQKIDLNERLEVVIYVVSALVTFQWITRAYLPQAVDHAVYMLIPVFVLRYLTKVKRGRQVAATIAKVQ